MPGARETRAFASEVKFLVSRAAGAAIRDWARRHLGPDPHGSGSAGDEYRITTIYLDSPEYDVYHRRGSYGRSKYRIRRYDEGSEVFLERKLRQPGLLAKRRTPVPLEALSALEDGKTPGGGQWFLRRVQLRRLRPVCTIAYLRTARMGETPAGSVRLTLDEGLMAASAAGARFEIPGEAARLLPDQTIVELKYRHDVPAIFKQLVEEFGLRPQPASKYRIGIEALKPEAPRVDTAPVRQDAVSGLPCA